MSNHCTIQRPHAHPYLHDIVHSKSQDSEIEAVEDRRNVQFTILRQNLGDASNLLSISVPSENSVSTGHLIFLFPDLPW